MPSLPLYIYTDGAARGNPGPGSACFVVLSPTSTTPVVQHGRLLGTVTNNQAEYLAVIEALSWLLLNQTNVSDVKFHLDSELLVNQLNGKFQVKNIKLQPLYQDAKNLVSAISIPINFMHIPRSQNALADSLGNQLLDSVVTSRLF